MKLPLPVNHLQSNKLAILFEVDLMSIGSRLRPIATNQQEALEKSRLAHSLGPLLLAHEIGHLVLEHDQAQIKLKTSVSKYRRTARSLARKIWVSKWIAGISSSYLGSRDSGSGVSNELEYLDPELKLSYSTLVSPARLPNCYEKLGRYRSDGKLLSESLNSEVGTGGKLHESNQERDERFFGRLLYSVVYSYRKLEWLIKKGTANLRKYGKLLLPNVHGERSFSNSIGRGCEGFIPFQTWARPPTPNFIHI